MSYWRKDGRILQITNRNVTFGGKDLEALIVHQGKNRYAFFTKQAGRRLARKLRSSGEASAAEADTLLGSIKSSRLPERGEEIEPGSGETLDMITGDDLKG